MRAFFDDLLAGLFVMAVLAASYIFLFAGTVQSGTMMGQALQHRLKIDQLRSAVSAFNHITEPNTKLPLAELVGRSALAGSDSIWVGEQAVDTRASCSEALRQLLGENFYFVVERPQKNVDLRIIIPQSSTMYDDYQALLSSLPELESRLTKNDLNATVTLYFLHSKSRCAQWCRSETRQVASCHYLELPTEGRWEQNWAEAVEQIAREKQNGMLIIVPLVDSLSSGNGADHCYSPCSVSEKCQFCNETCPVARSQTIVRKAAASSQSYNGKVCPILTSPCAQYNTDPVSGILACEGFTTSFCGSDCPNCLLQENRVCLGQICQNDLITQLQEISTATDCQYLDLGHFEGISSAIEKLVADSVEQSQFMVGQKPPKDKTSYSEDVLLPVNPPIKARLVIW